MAQQQVNDSERLTRAYLYPFVVFMGFTILLSLISIKLEWKHPAAPWWRQDPAQLLYPLQTLVVLGMLIYHWKSYEFRWSWKWCAIGAVFGAVGIGAWLLPTTLYDYWGMTSEPSGLLKVLGVAARKEGFDPGIFNHPVAYWASLTMRFLRAAVVVALVEEIFWRGFIMRIVADWEGDYWKQPFGRPMWKSYLIVTALFMGAHMPVDWAGALVFGSLMYLLCVWSKSLGACVVMHGVANLLMGIYVMAYGKYGLW